MVDSYYVSEGCEPRDYVCEFFLGGLSIFSFLEFFSQLCDLVHEPVVCSVYSAFGVSFEVQAVHHFLEFMYVHNFTVVLELSVDIVQFKRCQ